MQEMESGLPDWLNSANPVVEHTIEPLIYLYFQRLTNGSQLAFANAQGGNRQE
jgi:hypothetical protein